MQIILGLRVPMIHKEAVSMSKNDNVNDVFVLIMITIIIGSMIYSAYFS